jgi:hypothetical protein
MNLNTARLITKGEYNTNNIKMEVIYYINKHLIANTWNGIKIDKIYNLWRNAYQMGARGSVVG